MSKPQITWPEINGPSLIAATAYVAGSVLLVVLVWNWVPVVGVVVLVILSAVAFIAAESHLASSRIRSRSLEPDAQKTPDDDPEETWNA